MTFSSQSKHNIQIINITENVSLYILKKILIFEYFFAKIKFSQRFYSKWGKRKLKVYPIMIFKIKAFKK